MYLILIVLTVVLNNFGNFYPGFRFLAHSISLVTSRTNDLSTTSRAASPMSLFLPSRDLRIWGKSGTK